MDRREKKIVGISLSSMLILTAAVPLVLTLMFASAPTASAQTNLGGGDHGGTDWIIDHNTEIAGNHHNIDLFKIASGVTVTVKAYDGTSYGWVEIHAKNVIIEGTISANGAGYTGGTGGAGNTDSCKIFWGNAGTDGAGSGNGKGGPVNSSVYGEGGTGGGGSGYGSSGGAGGFNGGAGGPSYDSTGVEMGSGGGGGSSGSATYDGGYVGYAGSGGAGGRGGGRVVLVGENSVLITGLVSASGLSGGNGANASGSYYAGGGGGGGGGSGGGILIRGFRVDITGTLSVSGGSGGSGGSGAHGDPGRGPNGASGGGGSGGRIKILYCLFPSTPTCHLSGGGGNVAGGAGSKTLTSINVVPNSPTSLLIDGVANPQRLTTFNPTFSAVFSDNNAYDYTQNVWLLVKDSADDKVWNSGWLPIARTENNNRSPDVVYAGTPLLRGITYSSQIKFMDNAGENGAWSTETAVFRLNRLPSQTYSSPAGITIVLTPPPTITWNFSDPDGDTQLGVSVQVTTDNTFATKTHWDYEDNTSTAQSIPYGGTTLQRGVQYYVRVQVRDSSGEWSGTWATDNFILKGAPHITSVNASNTLIDRKINQVDSGAVDSTVIYVTARDNWGRSWIENAYIWIRDNADMVVVDNLQLTSYENIENAKRFFYDYNPDDSLTALGAFDVKAQVIGIDAAENTKNYTDLGYQLFEVNDLIVSLNLTDNTPIHQLSASGTITRIHGTASADNVVVKDNNEGIFIANFTDNSYSQNYGLVSPTPLHHGDQGYLSVWARDDTLDGVSPALTYEVQGDNATLSITTVNNQVGHSVVNISATWASDSSNVGSGTAYFETEILQATISNGTGQFTLDHSTWITSDTREISLYDNADRPLWNVTKTPLTTKSLLWAENQALSGSQDNASLTIKITYNDATTNNTIKAELLAGTVDNGQVTADENGLLIWSGINLPDSTQDIQIKLDNVYDSRTDWVINANSVEDVTLYTENTTCDFTIADNTLDVYYGSSGTFEGTVTSEANYVSLEVRENIHYDNDDLIENKSTTLPPGASDSWSFALSPFKTTLYKLKMLSPSGTLMWEQGASITVKLQTPSLVSPADASATNNNTPTLSWTSVSGEENYTLQYSTVENFDTYTENTTTENRYTLPELMENRYYWRVKATTTAENVENSAWSSTRNFWLDRTNPSILSFIINDGTSETTSLNVVLSISASDTGSGVHQMCFKNETGSWSSWEAYSTSKAWTLASGDGTKTVYAKVRDKALNESNMNDSITKITEEEPTPPPADTIPPTLTILEPITTEVGENVMVRVSASDSSGIDSNSIQAKLDEGVVEHTWTDGVVKCSFVRLSAGGHLVVVEVSDASSNHNQATVNISFTVVAPVENVENIENVTPTPTFTLQLPATPLEVENGYAQIMLWITNPTPQPIFKHCELQFNDHVKPFDFEVAAGENMLVTVWVDVAGMEGTYDMKLHDADTDTLLDEGEITLLASPEQPEAPPITLISPPLGLLIIGVVGVLVGLGMLRIAGRLPKIKMPKFRPKLPKVKIRRPSIRMPSLPRLPKIKHKPKLEKMPGRGKEKFKRISGRAGKATKPPKALKEEEIELVEESPVVQDIYHLLKPAARELVTEKKVGHIDRAVKPYKKRRRQK